MTRLDVTLCTIILWMIGTIHDTIAFGIPVFNYNNSPRGGVHDSTTKSTFTISTTVGILPTTTFNYESTLFMVRRSSGGGGGGSKSKSKNNKKKVSTSPRKVARSLKVKSSSTNNKHNKDNTQQQQPQPKKGSTTTITKKTSYTPPWQIMSTKDIKKNVNSELNRRDNIKQGKSSPSDFSTKEQKVANVDASNHLLSPTDRNLLAWKRFNPESAPGSMTLVGKYLGKDTVPSIGVPEIAFLGRSNVGKSSLLNKLISTATSTSTTEKARVGKTPGATASVNLYSLNNKSKKQKGITKPILGLVDLPGFGYAKISKTVKDSIQLAAERYLDTRKELALGVLLVDVRRIPSEDDSQVLSALYDMGVPLLVVATKVDKLSQNELAGALDKIRIGLDLPIGQPFYVSSSTGEGIRELWSIVMGACEDKIKELRQGIEKVQLQSNDNDYGTIKLNDQGNLNEEEDFEYDQGYDWGTDSKLSEERVDYDQPPLQEQLQSNNNDDDEQMNNIGSKTVTNEEMQAAQKDAMRMKNLRKQVRGLQRGKGV